MGILLEAPEVRSWNTVPEEIVKKKQNWNTGYGAPSAPFNIQTQLLFVFLDGFTILFMNI